jgi:Flp pilus assembly secretin CpaC
MLLVLSLLTSGVALAIDPTLRLDYPDKIGQLRLTIDKSQTHRASRPFTEALIANSEIADVVPLTDQSIYLVGKKIGMTRLTLLDENKRLLGIFDVEVSYDIAGLQQELHRSVRGGEFRLRTANGRILLSGTVPDAIALARAIDITEQFTSSCEAHRLKEVSEAVGDKPASATTTSLILQSPAAPRPQAAGNPQRCYVNLLMVSAPQQVLLEVRFVEARDGHNWENWRDRLRDGLSWLFPGPLLLVYE